MKKIEELLDAINQGYSMPYVEDALKDAIPELKVVRKHLENALEHCYPGEDRKTAQFIQCRECGSWVLAVLAYEGHGEGCSVCEVERFLNGGVAGGKVIEEA